MGLFSKKYTTNTHLPKVGESVLFIDEEGCQAMSVFKWVGKVVKKEKNKIYVKVLKYNNSYKDYRDFEEDLIKELTCIEGSGNMRFSKLDSMWLYYN